MHDDGILIIKGGEVSSLLAGRGHDLIEIVRTAYETHAMGQSSLPHSTFLHFPDSPGSRIIALPAYLGGGFRVAGLKWVASFSANLDHGMDRASAVVILNSAATGRPEAVIEGSIINAKRTAASAALATRHLLPDQTERTLALLGCGPINFEIARFQLAAQPQIARLVVYDVEPERAGLFKEKCLETFEGIKVELAGDLGELLSSSTLISLATTATQPHIADLSLMAAGSAILNISLRDLAPEIILSCDNIVDDIDHVCRAQTSVHLAEQLSGNRDFIRCTLADVIRGTAPARRDKGKIAVFSPFGLGVLDLAVGQFVRDLALDQKCGAFISSFLPDPWIKPHGDASRTE